MNEEEWMKKQGRLLTKKQYLRLLLSVTGFITGSLLTVIAGGIVAILARRESVFIIGFVIGVVGFILFLISLIFAFKNWSKIMLYRHYQKHTEDFNNDISEF